MASLSLPIAIASYPPASTATRLRFRAPAVVASPRYATSSAIVRSISAPADALISSPRLQSRAFPSPAVAQSAVRRLASAPAPRAFLVRTSSACLSSPFARAPPTLRFSQRVRQQLSNPLLSPSTSASAPSPSPRPAHRGNRRATSRPGQPRALLGPLLAATGAAFAAVFTALAALPITITALSVVTTAVAASAAAVSFLLPLLSVVLGVAGTVGLASLGLLWSLIDRLLCVLLVVNFAAGLLSLAKDAYRLNHARRRSLQDPAVARIWAEGEAEEDVYYSSDGSSSGGSGSSASSSSSGSGQRVLSSIRRALLESGDPRFDWFTPGIVSLVPGINGAAWLLASWHSSPFLSGGLKRQMAKNAAVYGLPGLLSLLVFALGLPSSPTSLLLAPLSSAATFLLSPFAQSAAVSAAGSAAVAGAAKAAAAAAAAGGGTGVAVGVVGYGGSSAWWVSVVLGAVHLQLERVRAIHMQETKELLRAFGRGLKRTRERGKRRREGRSEEGEGWSSGEERGGVSVEEGYGDQIGSRSSSSSGSGNGGAGGSGGGDVLWQAEERRRLRQFDAKLMSKALQQLGPPAAWTTDDVASWLTAEGFASHAPAFLDHAVCGQVLLELTADDLRNDLKVRALGDRKRLLAAIARLKQWFGTEQA